MRSHPHPALCLWMTQSTLCLTTTMDQSALLPAYPWTILLQWLLHYTVLGTGRTKDQESPHNWWWKHYNRSFRGWGGEGACTVLPGSPPCELVNPIIKSLSLMHTQKVSGKSISLQPQPTMLSLYSPCTRKCQCQVVIDLSALIDKTGQPIILCKMTPPQPLCTPSPQKLIKRNNAWCINKMTSHPPYKTYNSHTNSSMSSWHAAHKITILAPFPNLLIPNASMLEEGIIHILIWRPLQVSTIVKSPMHAAWPRDLNRKGGKDVVVGGGGFQVYFLS